MNLEHQKNTTRYLLFPMVNSTSPESYLTGASVSVDAYYKDGAGVWTSFAPADTVTEIGTTGMYELTLSAADCNHDQVVIKFTATGAADQGLGIDCRVKLAEDLNDFNSATDQVTVSTNNDKTGYSISGTLTTLDALDTAQDAQHSQTQADIAALNDYNPAVDQVIVGTNNDKTGYSISGVLTTLDALDTAQDAQHSATQADIAALNDFNPAVDQVIVATNNDKAGYSISGVLTTLDALDTAQDVQHASTQADIAALNDFNPAVDQVIVATNNDKAGYTISGTLTTLDSLDTQQDLQHAQTQSDIAALVIPTSDANADAVLSRSVSNVEVGLGEHTLGTIVLMGLESAAAGSTLTIYRTDGVTQHVAKTLTADPSADPVVGVS